ncbi:glycoside hydrolase family 30 protein [Pedobacter sp. SD-b]|uniref:Glycoside hydrolase family 30 protein n=1 Tax=Pedobacter segetis TaxID=2793069 RepID=A0ABS1BHE1_9SPHI|nr:glycoside hydrolase family 30 protein [Pedobacter segetis]MBK0382262.1 glycoside hydrolase family 30 protein [Pedobacter segetis]
MYLTSNKIKSSLSLSLFILLITGCAQKKTEKIDIKKATVFTTAESTNYRISKTENLKFEPSAQPLEREVIILVDPKHQFQSFIGIGGAITDASAETFAKLPKVKQQELLTAYFDADKGIGYTIGRTNINSCDFSSGSYTYVNDNDSTLASFDIKHDEAFKIPFIKKAMAAADNKLNLFVSPWSPPAWMKTNKSMLNGGKLLPRFRQAWANYYVKFINAYESIKIPVWGLSVQNEPMAKQTWESCVFTAEDERDFIKNYLGPTLKKNNLGNKKLIAWDHNRDLIYQRASVILNDEEAAKYVWGIGFHWYETWTGSKMQFNNVKKVHEAFPDKHLIFTEGCKEKFNLDSINNWSLGEKYGHSMINDFNDGTEAWTDWNILLDENGGPNHVGNFCFAPVHANTQTGQLIYTNAYYYIGQFSKFIKAGAKRIISTANRDDLEVTSFLNPDGKIITIVLNTTGKTIPFKLMIDAKAVKSKSLAHSISTFILES